MRVKQAAGNESAEMKNKNADERAMVKKVGGGDHEDDMSTGSSSSDQEEMESPRSTVAINYDKKWNNSNVNSNDDGPVHLHSQILRIRAEDSHIGEDIINHVLLLNLYGRKQQLQVLFSRPPILFHLPASPLSAGNNSN